MANSNVDIANKIFTYVKHGCDINEDIKTIYYNSLIFIGDEQQIYVPVMDTYVGIKKSQFDELSNNLLWIPSIGTYSITTKEGNNLSSGNYAISTGINTVASGLASFTQGENTIASGQGAHAEGHNTKATAKYSHSEGEDTEATSAYAHAEGNETHAIGENSHTEGYKTYGKGKYSHTEGRNTLAYGQSSHTEGAFTYTYDNAEYAHAEGFASYALGSNAHAENYKTVASGEGAHSEGGFTYALGKNSHTEGDHTYTYNTYEHTQGRYNISHKNSDTWGDSLNSLHTIGIGTNWNSRRNAIVVMQNGDIYTYNIGNYDGRNPESAETLQETTYRLSVWEKSTGNNSGRLINGNGLAQGELSVVSGVYTVAYNQGEFGVGSYNVSRSNNTKFTVGIGNSESNRKNAFEIANNGNAYFINIDNFNGNSNINSSRPLQTMIYSHELAITQSTLQDNGTYFGYALIGISTNNSGKDLSHTISYQVKAFTTKQYVDALMKANDALRYCGTVTPAPRPNEQFYLHHNNLDISYSTFNTHGSDADIDCGAVYKVDSSGYFGTEKVSAGDMIISYSDSENANRAINSNEGWNVINENLDLRTDPQTEAYNNASNDKVLTNVDLSADGTLSYTAHSLSILNKTGQYKPNNVVTGTDTTASATKNLIFNGTTQGYKIITDVSLTQNGLTTELSYSYAYFYANQKHHSQGKNNKGKNHLSISYTQFITNISLSTDGKLSYDYGEFNVEESEHALISTGLDEVVLKSGSDNKGVIVELFADENNDNKLTYSYINLTTSSGTYDKTISGNNFYISYITEIKQNEYGKISYSYSYAHIDYPFIFGTYDNAKANATLKNGQNNSSGAYSVAEGYFTSAQADYSHSEGYHSIAAGTGSHVEGGWTRAGTNDSINYDSILVNESNYVNYSYTHAEGYGSISKGFASHSEGNMSHAEGHLSHAEGRYTKAVGQASHTEGENTIANGKNSHAEGLNTTTNAVQAHAEGTNTYASYDSSHSEGLYTHAYNIATHAEGNVTYAYGLYSHVEGNNTTSYNLGEHATGTYNMANKASDTFGDAGNTEFTIGIGTADNNRKNAIAVHQNGYIYVHSIGDYNGTNYSSAESLQQFSYRTTIWEKGTGHLSAQTVETGASATGNYSIAEGDSTLASGINSHAEGWKTKATNNYEHAQGKWNVSTSGKTIHSIGIGSSEANRKNAFEVYNDGTTYIYESTYIGWRVNTTKLNIKSAEVLLQSGTTTNTVINLTSIAGLQFTDTKKLWGTI